MHARDTKNSYISFIKDIATNINTLLVSYKYKQKTNKVGRE